MPVETTSAKARRKWQEKYPGKFSRSQRKFYRELVISLLLQRDGNLCGFCGKPIKRGKASIDHIVGIAEGGPNVALNVRLAHLSCNKKDNGIKQIQTVCKRGHDLTNPENVYQKPNKTKRECRVCKRERALIYNKTYYQKRKNA